LTSSVYTIVLQVYFDVVKSKWAFCC